MPDENLPDVWVSETVAAEQGGYRVTYTFWDGERRSVVIPPDRYSRVNVDSLAEQLLAEKRTRG